MTCIAFVFLFLSLTVAVSVQDKVKVSVYYEALCGDSMMFVTRQLYPTYKKLHSIMELDLIPYGKAIQNKVNNKWKFECQHGPNECFGNKVQACALHQGYSEETSIAFINCVMGQRNPASAGEMCAKKINGVSWAKINNCVTSQAGDDYLAEYGDRTHSLNPAIAFVPTVTFNDQVDEDISFEALNNLTGLICKIMKYPSVCSIDAN